MPTGVHGSHHLCGRRPECACGACRVCKVREYARAYRRRQRAAGDDADDRADGAQLEARLTAYFKARGWDE